MIIIRDPEVSGLSACPYIPGENLRYEYFYATRVSAAELEELLAGGWRKFGYYYFRPVCPECRQCIPLRVTVNGFSPSKSQRRVERRGAGVQVLTGPLGYRDEIYDIYVDHSFNRFGRLSDRDEFIGSFFRQSCPALQAEYYLDGELFAVDFLDQSEKGLSSVYFIYRDSHRYLSPGTLSILRGIGLARDLGLDFYYLGYYIAANATMSYKNRFYPHEQLDTVTGIWRSSHHNS